MPSGITHILLTRYFNDRNANEDLHDVFASGRDFIQVGSVAPDLPYSSVADSDVLESETEMADNFHYRKTNEIPLNMLRTLKTEFGDHSLKSRHRIFSFVAGYISHVVADGLMHPFVRDKVGDYAENKTDHRVLEMRLDVLFYKFYQDETNGLFRYSNLHDELMNFENEEEADPTLQLFTDAIDHVYGFRFGKDKILGWITAIHLLFDIAEGAHPFWYKNLPIIDDYLFPTYEEIENKKNELIILEKPKDVDVNFLKTDKVNFFEDCVPKFLKVFGDISEKAYNYVFNDGEELTDNDIPPIDLDTGRPIMLDLTPTLWS